MTYQIESLIEVPNEQMTTNMSNLSFTKHLNILAGALTTSSSQFICFARVSQKEESPNTDEAVKKIQFFPN